MIVAQGMVLAGVGVAIGLAAAYAWLNLFRPFCLG